jgi:uncharacterized protein YegP (UPF0339 family)
MAGTFELYEDKSGGFRFRLKAGNGEVIAVSESYATKASALNGIASVQKNAPTATVDDQTWRQGVNPLRVVSQEPVGSGTPPSLPLRSTAR